MAEDARLVLLPLMTVTVRRRGKDVTGVVQRVPARAQRESFGGSLARAAQALAKDEVVRLARINDDVVPLRRRAAQDELREVGSGELVVFENNVALSVFH